MPLNSSYLGDFITVEEKVVRYLFKQGILGKSKAWRWHSGRESGAGSTVDTLVVVLSLTGYLQTLLGCASRVPKHLVWGTTISSTFKTYHNNTVLRFFCSRVNGVSLRGARASIAGSFTRLHSFPAIFSGITQHFPHVSGDPSHSVQLRLSACHPSLDAS